MSTLNQDTSNFFNLMYQNVPGYIQLTAIWPTELGQPPDYHLVCESKALDAFPTLLERAQRRNEQGYGVFFRVATVEAPISGFNRGSEMMSHCIPALWAEIDSVKHGETATSRLQILMDFPLRPSIIINSGGGLHAYWLLEKPVALQIDDDGALTGDALDAKRIMRGLSTRLDSDPSVAELARVLRVPGTINTKPSRNGAAVKILYMTDTRYSFDQFRLFAPPQEKIMAINAQTMTKRRGRYPEWMAEVLQGPIPEGGGPFGGRNNSLYRAAFVMARKGDAAEIDRTVGAVGRASGLTDREVATLIRSAIRRASRV